MTFGEASQALDSNVCQLAHLAEDLDVLPAHSNLFLQNVPRAHVSLHAGPVVAIMIVLNVSLQ